MYTFIGIESLAANALISLLEENNVRVVSFDTLVNYGMEITRIYKRDTGEDAILLLSREYQLNMIANYSDFFDVKIDNAGQGVFCLKDDVDIEQVKFYFRDTMKISLLKAFLAPEVLEKLGVLA